MKLGRDHHRKVYLLWYAQKSIDCAKTVPRGAAKSWTEEVLPWSLERQVPSVPFQGESQRAGVAGRDVGVTSTALDDCVLRMCKER